MSDEAASAVPTLRVVNESLRCDPCGYELRGLPVAWMCPECNASIALSEVAARERAGRLKGWRMLLLGLIAHVFGVVVGTLSILIRLMGEDPLISFVFAVAVLSFLAGSAMLAGSGVLKHGRGMIPVSVCMFSPLPLIIALGTIENVWAVLDYGGTALIALMIFAQFTIVAMVHRRAADALSRAGTSKSGRIFCVASVVWHLVCLVWVLGICALGMISEDLMEQVGIAYLYTFPLHSVWFVWLVVRSLMLVRALRA